MKLYVNSISTGGIKRSPGLLFHSCDLKTVKNITFYPEEDEEAIEFLKSKKISFELIDLSHCSFLIRTQVKIKGINRTPTLVLDDGTKLEGIKQIKSHFKG
jgi:hypothetical protein